MCPRTLDIWCVVGGIYYYTKRQVSEECTYYTASCMEMSMVDALGLNVQPQLRTTDKSSSSPIVIHS